MVCCVFAACASSGNTSGDTRKPGGNATVIRSSEMTGSVLHTLRTRVPSIRISTEGQRCPSIRFRGDLSVLNQPEPSIYIDGGLVAEILPPVSWGVFLLNMQQGPMANLKLRQAFQASLDHESIAVAGW